MACITPDPNLPLNRCDETIPAGVKALAWHCAGCFRKGEIRALHGDLANVPIAERCDCGSEWLTIARMEYLCDGLPAPLKH
jgi:hypothetical protein